METPKTEGWFCWRVYETPEGEDKPRLLIPHSDPNLYEYPLDGLFGTPEEAIEYLKQMGEEGKEYHLCHMTLLQTESFIVKERETTLTRGSDGEEL